MGKEGVAKLKKDLEDVTAEKKEVENAVKEAQGDAGNCIVEKTAATEKVTKLQQEMEGIETKMKEECTKKAKTAQEELIKESENVKKMLEKEKEEMAAEMAKMKKKLAGCKS